MLNYVKNVKNMLYNIKKYAKKFAFVKKKRYLR